MECAFRTDVDVIRLLEGEVTEAEIKSITDSKTVFKKKIQPLIYPRDGIIRGDTLKDSYFPSVQFDGTNYDVFISHSHKNVNEAYLLAAWLKKTKGITCFVDSFAWASADQLLKKIDDDFCYQKHTKTYNYRKRNFTTSHVHALLSMALLDTIQRSKYCIFIESSESVSLSSKLKKESLSPWLYEEIKYMQLFQPRKERKLFSEALEKACNFQMSYDISGILEFPYLDLIGLRSFNFDYMTEVFG